MTTLVRWNTGRWAPVREVAVMQNELSRLMNGLFEGTGRPTQSWVPALDAWETESELVYAFDLPGIPQDEISVEVEDGTLTVSAERSRSTELTEGGFHRAERRYGSFTRSVGLPQGVAEDAIKATYTDGVLEIHVPKPSQPKPKKIEIGVEPATIEAAPADEVDPADAA
jgi:HSP20 family protein